MIKDNVIALKKPESIIVDQLTDMLRKGARKLLAHTFQPNYINNLFNYMISLSGR